MKKENQIENHGALSIVTTIFPPYDFVKAIGKEHVQVTMLLKPGMESHSYEPTPQDMIKIKACDLFIYAGGESDTWVEGMLDSMDEKVHTMTLMDCVEPLEEEQVPGMEAEKDTQEHGKADREYDEHVWTAPGNAKLIVSKIEKELCNLDNAHATEYQSAARQYKEELTLLDNEYRQAVENGVRKELVFGDRFPFRYLCEAYGLSYYAAFPGCSSETEASAATIAFLTDKIKEDKIPVILYLELSNHKIADAIAETTGAETKMLHSCHNVSEAEIKTGVTYLSLMKQNLEVLKGALQ